MIDGVEPADHVERSRAVYGQSAELYVKVIGTEVSTRFEAAEDRAALEAFAELAVEQHGRVLDAGCGPGRITRHLADRHLDVVGVDIAPGMIEQARMAHPDLEFHVANLTSLPFDADSFAAVSAWYSIITTPPDHLPTVWAELRRVVRAGGPVLLGFQSGHGERADRPNAYGTPIDLTLFRHDVDVVCQGLKDALFHVRSVTKRSPVGSDETTGQAFVIAVAADIAH